jgi:hypothetical protein
MTNGIKTEVGDNWSVFYFECQRNRFESWLIDLFRHISTIKEAKLPHFMIREFSPHIAGVSLRVLRDQKVAETVDTKLTAFFKTADLRYQKDPEGNHHAWIRKGETDSKWNKSRCEALSQLSRFAVFLAENNMFDTDSRCHNAHYLVNMLALREATKAKSNQVFFVDAINGMAIAFETYVF